MDVEKMPINHRREGFEHIKGCLIEFGLRAFIRNTKRSIGTYMFEA